MENRWQFYTSAAGRNLVKKEFAKLKLQPYEQQKIKRLMKKRAAGKDLGKNDKVIVNGGGLRELVIDCGNRSFRLIYAMNGGGLLLLALKFFQKTSQTAPHDIEIAKERYKEWLRDNSERG